MHLSHHLRRTSRLAGVLLAVSALVPGVRSQGLPATPPTSLPGQVGPGATLATTPAPDPPRHAEVILTYGLLQVRADNSSLNQILRSISRITGMKITGGVEEQRVFGTYGPAPLSTVLATLLDGTGANILLLGGNADTPPELVLTSRAGGPELPGPNSPAYAMYDDRNDRASRVGPASAQAPITTSPTPSPAVPASAPAGSTPSPANGPAKALTPEMVMQELQQMQAQQNASKPAQSQSPPPAGSNPH